MNTSPPVVNLAIQTPDPSSNDCPSLLLEHLSRPDAEQIAALFRVLGEPSRLQLLSLIASQPTGAACVCELIAPLGLSQPTVSHHLKVLHEAGFLTKERHGTWIYYKVVPEALQALSQSITQPLSSRPLSRTKTADRCC
ncbi:MAG: metalloregulator ArsR/SmtB family transcription factor [Thermosynechococcaceae cyanobacterium MS004]|nr:metalloregulator ArsR/SmtB family transcription factor [Thermosynechococcaceae cyanobacterium MS004]